MATMMPPGEDLKRKTEEELLASDTLTEEERRRIKRRASNRESARRTRYKRTEKLKELEDKKALITEENAKIVNQIHELEKIYWDALLENRQLKSEIQVLRAAKPQLSALCPSSLGTVFNTTQPVAPDFLSMSLPLGTVPPAPPLSLNSDVAGMPNPHLPTHVPEPHTLPGLGPTPPASILSLPPPLSTNLPGGLPAFTAAAPGEGEQVPNPALPMNFTSMLEGVESDPTAAHSASSIQAALAQFYATSGIAQPAIAGVPPAKPAGAEAAAGVTLPPPADAALPAFDPAHFAPAPASSTPLVPAPAPESIPLPKTEELPGALPTAVPPALEGAQQPAP